MYTRLRDPATVREPGEPYAPRPRETFPAADVLDDLEVTDSVGAARILCRYAVLRAWELKRADAPRALVRHARSAARAHLRSMPPDWEEGRALRSLLTCPSPRRCAALLRAAAAASEAAGQPRGARALTQAAWRAEGGPGGRFFGN